MTLTRLRAALLAALFGLTSCTPAFAEIKDWSTTPGSNATVTDSTYGNIGFAEGQAPSTLNDSARALMAHVRAWYQSGGWTNLGYTHTYASATSVTVAGTDVTAFYPPGSRVKAVGSLTGTIYGRVSNSNFSTNTTINVQWDSGSLSSETLTISRSFFSATGSPSPSDLVGVLNTAKGANIASAASPSATDIGAATGNVVHITGTNSMGSFGTAPQAGIWRLVIFDGAATLIHNTNLVLPGAADITTAAGDWAIAVADTTTKWYVASYNKASGRAVVGGNTPTVQTFTSSSGTYTTPANVTWIDVEIVGSGGGGGGSATSGTGGAGGNGNNTTFSTLTAGGGTGGGGSNTSTGGLGGAGGSASGGDTNIIGGSGQSSDGGGSNQNAGGSGGNGCLGGGGAGGNGTNAGNAGATNTGGGGGGAGQNGAGGSGAGGGSGGCVRKIITSPASTYSYAVGAAGAAGAAGSGGLVGGAGAAGYIVVREFYN